MAARAVLAPRGNHGDTEPAGIDPWAGPGPDDVAEPISVVGHEDRRRRRVHRPVGSDPPQIELGARRAEDRGHGVEQRADLGVAVALALHRLGVQTHRDVVDEDAPVDLAEVDEMLPAVDERIQGAHHVVAVDAEVQGEMVARTRRDAGVRQPVPGGGVGDDGLRAVPTRRGQPVGPRGDGIGDELLEVVAAAQLDGPDTAPGCLLGQPHLGRLPTTGPRVDEQHRALGRRGGRRRRCTRNAARAAAWKITTPTTSPTRKPHPLLRNSSAPAPTRATTATTVPITRGAPRRTTANHAATIATAMHTRTPSPLGKRMTATATAISTVNPAESSATAAATRWVPVTGLGTGTLMVFLPTSGGAVPSRRTLAGLRRHSTARAR